MASKSARTADLGLLLPVRVMQPNDTCFEGWDAAVSYVSHEMTSAAAKDAVLAAEQEVASWQLLCCKAEQKASECEQEIQSSLTAIADLKLEVKANEQSTQAHISSMTVNHLSAVSISHLNSILYKTNWWSLKALASLTSRGHPPNSNLKLSCA